MGIMVELLKDQTHVANGLQCEHSNKFQRRFDHMLCSVGADLIHICKNGLANHGDFVDLFGHEKFEKLEGVDYTNDGIQWP